jgi:hypothetical protein
VVLLRRAPALVVDAPSLDDGQQAVLDARGPLLRVLGAPGPARPRRPSSWSSTGSCSAAVARRVPAADLDARRRRATAPAGDGAAARTSTEPLARTHQAFGFGILRRETALRGTSRRG